LIGGFLFGGVSCIPQETQQRAHWVTVVRVLPEGDFAKVVAVRCEVDDADLPKSKQIEACEGQLKVTALRNDADVVVVETQNALPDCAQCLTMTGAAYRRVLPWETARIARPEFKASTQREKIASGTGFFVTATGKVLTAFHVVNDAKSVEVTVADGRTLPAHVDLSDVQQDLSVLQIDGDIASLQAFLRLADSEAVQIGSPVWTLGFPVTQVLGSGSKYTEGTVSSLSGPGDAPEFFQVTVPIQPGNSGGPLLNVEGEVVGVITATAAIQPFFRVTGSLPQGVNWAVKGNLAKKLFQAPTLPAPSPAVAPALSRQDAIARAQKALCYVQVHRN
jgi:S1-C subfamily serine protease